MRVVLGVGGGIAAYKSAEVVRALQQRGHEVQVVMTASAQEFIQPLTLAALSGKKVITGLFSQDSSEDTLSSAIEHIAVARDNDCLLIAPATADILAKLAHGIADDFLSTLYLAFEGLVVVAPAMNDAMWSHAATKVNVQLLRSRGVHVIEPEDGWLACGVIGSGRLASPVRIAEEVHRLTTVRKDLDGEVVLVTAGPTRRASCGGVRRGSRSSSRDGA